MDELTAKQEIGSAICAVIRAALPEATQTTKWNAPNFSVDGQDLITLNFSPRNPVRIVFHRGAKAIDTKTGNHLVGDETGRLTWATDQRAYASFAEIMNVHTGEAWLAEFCRKWVRASKALETQ